MIDLVGIQIEIEEWRRRNFPGSSANQQLFGIVEELGELCHSILKQEQGIRTNENHIAKERDAIGDMLIFLLNYCSFRDYILENIIRDTWKEVSQRDWIKYKKDGVSE